LNGYVEGSLLLFVTDQEKDALSMFPALVAWVADAGELAVGPDDQVVPAFVLACLGACWAPSNKAGRLATEVCDKVELEAWVAVWHTSHTFFRLGSY